MPMTLEFENSSTIADKIRSVVAAARREGVNIEPYLMHGNTVHFVPSVPTPDGTIPRGLIPVIRALWDKGLDSYRIFDFNDRWYPEGLGPEAVMIGPAERHALLGVPVARPRVNKM